MKLNKIDEIREVLPPSQDPIQLPEFENVTEDSDQSLATTIPSDTIGAWEGSERVTPNERYFEGKRVVIVGPSPSLKGTKQSEFIDSFDIVVRVNKGWWPATNLDPEVSEKLCECLYHCTGFDNHDPEKPLYKSFEDFREIEYNNPHGSLREDIGTRTDVLYNNYDTNTSSGGIVHPGIMIEAGIDMVIGSRFPTDSVDIEECERFLTETACWGGIGFGLVAELVYKKAMVNLKGKTPHAGHSAILDLLYGTGRLAKSIHIMGFSYYSEMPAEEYYMGKKAWEHVANDFDENMNSQINDNHEYGHDNDLELEDIARIILKEGPDGEGRLTCDQLLLDRVSGVLS